MSYPLQALQDAEDLFERPINPALGLFKKRPPFYTRTLLICCRWLLSPGLLVIWNVMLLVRTRESEQSLSLMDHFMTVFLYLAWILFLLPYALPRIMRTLSAISKSRRTERLTRFISHPAQYLLSSYLRVRVKRSHASPTPDESANDPITLRHFWRLYHTISYGLTNFHDDYCLACRRWFKRTAPPKHLRQLLPLPESQPLDCWSFVMFLDSNFGMEVPCPAELDDKAFLTHLRTFWNVARSRKGLLNDWRLRVLGRVDISQVCTFVPS